MKVVTIILLSLFFSLNVFSQEVKTLELINVENVKIKKEIKREESDTKTPEFKKGSKFTFVYRTSADTKPTKELRAFLDKLADWMKINPKASIRVTGHSDQNGTGKDIQDRAEQRAKKVNEYLITKSESNAKNILFTGEGARQPIADIYSEMEKAQNRRVEIDIISE